MQQQQEKILMPEYATCRVKSISQSGMVLIETSEAVITDTNFAENGLEYFSVNYAQHSSSVIELEQKLGQPSVIPLDFKERLISV